LIRFDTAIDAGFCRNHHLITDYEMISEASLTADHDISADSRASSDAHLCDKDAMLSDSDIVGNLDQVIDFGPLFDQGMAEGSTVDRHIRTEFHIVLNDHVAELGDLMVSALMLNITEPVSSNDRTAMDDHTSTKATAFADHDIGIENAIISDR
jgi:hypothetical protein